MIASAASEPLVLGVDARCLRIQRTGVERMFYNFVINLPGRISASRIVLFTDGPLEDDALNVAPFETAIVPVAFPRTQRLFDVWMVVQLAGEMKRLGVNVFYSPNTKFPFCRTRSYVTVHGLEWHVRSADYPLAERIKQMVWFSLCTRFSAGIVTFAENTRSDILRLRPRLRLPVCVTGEAAAAMFRRLPEHEINRFVPHRLGIRVPYILSVCSLEPRKNIDSLIEAFAAVARDQSVSHTLVLVGRAAWRSSRLGNLVATLGIEDRVHFAGYVGDDDLVQLYNQASVFVYPSKYEGFGLPVLEAMACGVPVACSEAGALREVAGDAALLFDPDSTDQIVRALRTLLADGTARQTCIDRGYRRAAEFSWTRTTDEIVRFIASPALAP